MDYEKVSYWASITFGVVSILNILVNLFRRGSQLGLFFYVAVVAASVALWSFKKQMTTLTERLATAEVALNEKPEFPTVEIERSSKPSKIDEALGTIE